MTTIELTAFAFVFITYTASQHLLNWWARKDDKLPGYAKALPLIVLTFLMSNAFFITFLMWMIKTI